MKPLKRPVAYLSSSIVYTNVNGKVDVVILRTTVVAILQAFYDAPRLGGPVAEKWQIVKVTADLIKNDFKCMAALKYVYPNPENIG